MQPDQISMWVGVWDIVKNILQALIQVGLLSFLIYLALIHLRGTRALGVMAGLMIVMVVGWTLSQLLGLEEIEWLLSKAPTLIAFALIITFQPELRRAFAGIGANPQRLLNKEVTHSETISAILDAVYYLGQRKVGALIAIERCSSCSCCSR